MSYLSVLDSGLDSEFSYLIRYDGSRDILEDSRKHVSGSLNLARNMEIAWLEGTGAGSWNSWI